MVHLFHSVIRFQLTAVLMLLTLKVLYSDISVLGHNKNNRRNKKRRTYVHGKIML